MLMLSNFFSTYYYTFSEPGNVFFLYDNLIFADLVRD